MIMITPSLFEVPRNAVLVDIPNHLRNEEFSKRFIEKFENFTDSLYDKHEVGYEKSQAITSTYKEKSTSILSNLWRHMYL